jgi:hypothetical protein
MDRLSTALPFPLALRALAVGPGLALGARRAGPEDGGTRRRHSVFRVP